MMEPGPTVIALQQTVISDYRQAVFDVIHERCGETFQIWCGESYFDPTLRTSIGYSGPMTRVDNVFFLGRRLEWQRGVLRPLLSADVAIIELNPRILSSWLVLIGRRLLKRRSVLWGHAWSRRGRESPTDVLRQLMRKTATIVLVYTEQQRAELKDRMPRAQILAAPNAIYRRDTIQAVCDGDPVNVVFSGRLIPSKKPSLAVDAFLWAVDHGLAPEIRLVIAGDGPERAQLKRRCELHPAGARVHFLGHVPPWEMGQHYARALVSVSPGYVGLSIIQSLSFGVPMVYGRDEPHAPEIEAARRGFNSLEVPSDDVAALGRGLLKVIEHRKWWVAQRERIAQDCRTRYSAEAMADRILEAACGSAATPSHVTAVLTDAAVRQ